jgi:hypothetical protein
MDINSCCQALGQKKWHNCIVWIQYRWPRQNQSNLFALLSIQKKKLINAENKLRWWFAYGYRGTDTLASRRKFSHYPSWWIEIKIGSYTYWIYTWNDASDSSSRRSLIECLHSSNQWLIVIIDEYVMRKKRTSFIWHELSHATKSVTFQTSKNLTLSSWSSQTTGNHDL